jgi:replication factor C small subunit
LFESSSPGTGKTSLAKLIVNNLDCDYLYINASDKGGVDFVREQIIPFVSSMGFKQYKVVILDESDYMSPNAQAALRNCMETFSKSSRFILTANYKERMIEPIRSRCQNYEIIPPSKKEIALRMVDILKKENIEYTNEDLALIVNTHYPDMRATIYTINKNIRDGKLCIDEESHVLKNFKVKILEYLKMNDRKDAFKSIRQLLLDEGMRDYSAVFKLLYDEVDNYAKGHIADSILVIAEYHYRDSFCVDKEINFAAMIVELLKTIHST